MNFLHLSFFRFSRKISLLPLWKSSVGERHGKAGVLETEAVKRFGWISLASFFAELSRTE